MIQRQQEKVQVCKNKRVIRIVGVRRVDKQGMGEPRKEDGLRERVSRGSWHGAG